MKPSLTMALTGLACIMSAFVVHLDHGTPPSYVAGAVLGVWIGWYGRDIKHDLQQHHRTNDAARRAWKNTQEPHLRVVAPNTPDKEGDQ